MPFNSTSDRFLISCTTRKSGAQTIEEVTEVARDLSAHEAVRRIRGLVAAAHLSPAYRDALHRWDFAYLYGRDHTEAYRIEPENNGDRIAAAKLMATALREHWPGAGFTVVPDGKRRHVTWFDGPTEASAATFLQQLLDVDYHVKPKHVVLHRLYSTYAWNLTVEAVAHALRTIVQRTASGEIDWSAVAARSIALPVTINARKYQDPSFTHYYLDELMRLVIADTTFPTDLVLLSV